MTSDRAPLFGTVLARTISAVFHPLLMPLYGMLIIFSAPTLLGFLPFTIKKVLFIIVLINNVLVPLSLIPYFKYRNIIASWTIEDRKERTIPLIATSFFYSVTVYLIFRFNIPVFIKSFVLISAFLAIAVTIINFWWKISIHSVGVGALTALVVVLSVKMQTPLSLFLVAVVLSAGIVMTSRLYLNAHTPGEVWSGFLLGVAGSAFALVLF